VILCVKESLLSTPLEKLSPHFDCFSVQGVREGLNHVVSAGRFKFHRLQVSSAELVVFKFIHIVSD
jgi:hypothetical protein